MKAAILMAIFALLLGNGLSHASDKQQTVTAEFKVLGLCSMCKSRIEKAAKVDGVTSAVWDMKTHILKIQYLPSKVSLEAVHKNIARAGHDTEKERADDAVYNKLPACCKYERSIKHSGK